jgi:hypothetical protein
MRRRSIQLHGCFSMIRLILALSAATATEIARKVPPASKAYPLMQGACWWEPPSYYRHYAYFPYYLYDDSPASGCHSGYYAPRWSGYRWNIWTN